MALHDFTIINPGYEIGDMTGWTLDVNTPETRIDNPNSGTFYSRLGNTAAHSFGAFYQDVNLPVAIRSLALQGALTFRAACWQDDFSGDTDLGQFRVGIFNSSLELIQCLNQEHHSDNNGTWAQIVFDEPLHKDAHFVRLRHQGIRLAGTELSFYSDDNEAQVNSTVIFRYDIGLVNPSADDGTNGWTTTSGDLNVNQITAQSVPNPNPSSNFFYAANTSAFVAEQVITLADSYGLGTALDTGSVQFTLTYMQGSFRNLDEGNMAYEFLDISDVVVGTGSHVNSNNTKQWQVRSIGDVAPVDTRKIKLVMQGVRQDGSNLDARFCGIQAYFTVSSNFLDGVQEPPWPAPLPAENRGFPTYVSRGFPQNSNRRFPID